jgi:membrane protein DedA with SNARE-associated domain
MNKPNKKKQLNKYLQLTGITFQMGITIFLGAYFGKKLDAHYDNSTKTFTIILTLVALLISIWSVLAQLKNINEKND